ncbi:MAG: restriction endonuclease subunit R [Elainella sp.]
MVQTLQAKNVTLRDLIDQFQLQLVEDDRFFFEWQEGLPSLTELEMQELDKIRAGYSNLRSHSPVLERGVQLAVLSPMLFLANFYLPPFQIRTEQSTEIAVTDGETVIRGQLDILLLKEGFWLMAIESKEFALSPEAGIAQLLAYMLAAPIRERPLFGLITSGRTFQFIKLIAGDRPQYAMSDDFGILNRVNGLYHAFRIMKRIGQL